MENYILGNQWVILVIILWTLPWKGIALWKAARKGHPIWFIALLILNTLGILDILYIVFFSKEREEKKEEKNSDSTKNLKRNGEPRKIV